MISLEKRIILKPLQKLPKNVGDLAKLIVAKGFTKVAQSAKELPNLVTLMVGSFLTKRKEKKFEYHFFSLYQVYYSQRRSSSTSKLLKFNKTVL